VLNTELLGAKLTQLGLPVSVKENWLGENQKISSLPVSVKPIFLQRRSE